MASFYEFFAGGGMVRAGLGPSWECLFANDFDRKKSATYRLNWGEGELLTCDVRQVKAGMLSGKANLLWGSFPCQDLSLAGAGAGLRGDRSGTFWPFWDVVRGLIADGRAPEIIALENVVGTLHSHKGRDFAEICSVFQRSGYRVGAMVVDASLFVPQSRQRLFIIGSRDDLAIPKAIHRYGPSPIWHNKTLIGAFEGLSEELRKQWVWWDMPRPAPRSTRFADLVEESPSCVSWHSASETRKLLAMMSSLNLQKVREAKRLSQKTGRLHVGTIYKRTRMESGYKVQRAEVRFDDVAGCLRTPAGGSSRQLIIVVDGDKVRSRLISSRETARLMGLPEKYKLPPKYNEAYHLTGDGVAVPVVRHLAQHVFMPLLQQKESERVAA